MGAPLGAGSFGAVFKWASQIPRPSIVPVRNPSLFLALVLFPTQSATNFNGELTHVQVSSGRCPPFSYSSLK